MRPPLTPPSYWVLTALADGRRHGYDILRETRHASGGRVDLKATTLYSALERLERDGLIAQDGEEIVDGRARRYYRLEEAGATRLEQEVEALALLVTTARARLARPRPVTS